MADILNVKEPILKDDSIDEYEYFEYEPTLGTNLNNDGGQFRIDILNKDIFLHPSESYLNFVGQLVHEDNGDAYAGDGEGTRITLVNNAMMYLFKAIRYQLEEQDIEYINYPGYVIMMLGLLKYPDDFAKSQGLNQCWFKDLTKKAEHRQNNGGYNAGFAVRRQWIFSSDPRGTFNFCVPLKHIFGFCEDYRKVVYGMKHSITLTRTNNENAIFKSPSEPHDNAAAAATNNFRGKIVLNKISWFMPHVIPEISVRAELLQFIEKKESFPVGYRMIQADTIAVPVNTDFAWRLATKSSPEVPRFIIVGFQSVRNVVLDINNDVHANPGGADLAGVGGGAKNNPLHNRQLHNAAIFDHLKVRNIKAVLSTKQYPHNEHNVNFKQNLTGRLYNEAASFRQKFYNMDELVSNPNINPDDFKNLYPLFVFDVSKHSERVKYSITDIHIRANFTENPPPNTQAFAVLLSDRMVNFQSDGNK